MTDIENNNIVPATKEEVIQQIAKTLADRRQARHVTLQAVSQRIKIRVPLLEAIESGKWDELPGDVYIRGFVIRYAQYLGLDGNNLVDPYLKVSSNPDSKSKLVGAEPSLGEGAKSAWLWITLIIIACIVLIKFLKPAEIPVQQRLNINFKRIDAPAVSTVTTPVAAKPVIAAEHFLEIVSPYQLWLKINTPKKVFEGFIPEGSTWSFKSEGQFQIKLGHTQDVLLKFDGRPVPLLDRQKTITLPSES